MRVCLIIFDCFPWFARLVCRSSRPAMPYSGSTCTTCVRSGTSAMAGVPERAHVVQAPQLSGMAEASSPAE